MTGPSAPRWYRFLPWLLAAGGLIGLLAAFVLTVEKIALITDPGFTPSCNISPILSCGSVMETPQASVFGFPNSLIGIAGFAGVAMIGFALVAGATFRRWFWLGLQAGVIFGMGFVFWLMGQSVFVIGALCPYCMVVWSVMIPIFWYVTLSNLSQGYLGTPASKGRAIARYHREILLVAYAIPVGIILNQFWDYWASLFF